MRQEEPICHLRSRKCRRAFWLCPPSNLFSVYICHPPQPFPDHNPRSNSWCTPLTLFRLGENLLGHFERGGWLSHFPSPFLGLSLHLQDLFLMRMQRASFRAAFEFLGEVGRKLSSKYSCHWRYKIGICVSCLVCWKWIPRSCLLKLRNEISFESVSNALPS